MTQRRFENENGLSFTEWLNAAGKEATRLSVDELIALTAAWERGEDPTEHRQ
jgi:hypothetical protein